ncbi:MAG: M23 family metallopeptidase [Opitutaceae bacterium]|nr:M23 family metallopeptidase [Cytophagales bacterium]
MARIKFYYDTETCQYERVKATPSEIMLNIAGFLLVSAVFSGLLFFVFSAWFGSPNEKRLQKENEELKTYYEILNNELNTVHKMMGSLQDRDDNIYRVIFESQPIPESVRSANIGGINHYKELLDRGVKQDELILNTLVRVDKLKKQMYIQTKSYDEIVVLAKNKNKMMASMPAIQPVMNKELHALVSGFGYRIHPIYKVKKMHTGVDFHARMGTPVYSTGDGVISRADHEEGGYGNQIEVNHGFGYITKYAHLSAFSVHVGQKIKRGELIAHSGNSGTSVAPHLHYEVIKNGTKVNPVYYFYNDLDSKEYQEILRLASVENQSLGGE